MADKPNYTENEAQALHNYRQSRDSDHDPVSCWCCCWTCEFDFDAIMGTGKATGEADGP